jgi:hypothetical protein
VDDRRRNAKHAHAAWCLEGYLKIGTEVKISGYQAKDGSNRANGRDITYPDGRKLFLGSTGTGAPYEQEGKDADKPK